MIEGCIKMLEEAKSVTKKEMDKQKAAMEKQMKASGAGGMGGMGLRTGVM